jgi:hypothetical protein
MRLSKSLSVAQHIDKARQLLAAGGARRSKTHRFIVNIKSPAIFNGVFETRKSTQNVQKNAKIHVNLA